MAKKRTEAKVRVQQDSSGNNEKSSGKQDGKIGSKTLWLLAFFSVAVALGTALFLLSSVSAAETEPTPITSSLIEFYGKECPHCIRMTPIITEVEAKANVTFSRLEVWHNSGNARLFERYSEEISRVCGDVGVPTFYDMRSGRALCGEVSESELLEFVRSG